jgi:hypothetical protein
MWYTCSCMIKPYHVRFKKKNWKWFIRLRVKEKTLKISISSQLCFLFANISSNTPSKYMIICSVLTYLMYFSLMNNTSLLDIIMFYFRHPYTLISFRYCLLHTMNLNKWISKILRIFYELKQRNQTIQSMTFF